MLRDELLVTVGSYLEENLITFSSNLFSSHFSCTHSMFKFLLLGQFFAYLLSGLWAITWIFGLLVFLLVGCTRQVLQY